MVNDQARAQLRDVIQGRLLAGTSERLRSNAALRAGLATSLLMGMVLCRRVIGVPVRVAADPEELVALIAPAIQQIHGAAAGAPHLKPSALLSKTLDHAACMEFEDGSPLRAGELL